MSRCTVTGCTERHCALCRREHVTDVHPLTCPGCVGRVRERLARIAELHANDQLEEEAAHHPDAAIPGGPAMVLLGPVSRGDWGERGDNPLFEVPPLLTLATWEDDWRRWSGHPAGPLATVGNAVGYLDGQLTRMAQQVTPKVDADGDEEWPPDFAEFAADIAVCLRRVEDVLRAGDRDDVSKTPCLDCGARLVRRYAQRVADDRWVCPRCRRRYTDGEFARAQHQQLAGQGAERFVKLADACQACTVPEQTVRTWLKRGQLEACCDLSTRAVLVWWPTARALDREASVRLLRRRGA